MAGRNGRLHTGLTLGLCKAGDGPYHPCGQVADGFAWGAISLIIKYLKKVAERCRFESVSNVVWLMAGELACRHQQSTQQRKNHDDPSDDSHHHSL